MFKRVMFTMVLLVCAVWLQAQSDTQKSNMQSVQGCLKVEKSQYWLTDSAGTVHRLSGHAQELKKHVGHEIEVTGKETVRTISTTQQEGMASTAKEIPVFHVSSIKHIADTCKQP